MPTKKQRRRSQKERRHEYETVWVNGEGNELEEPPEEAAAPARERHASGKSKAKSKPQQQARGGRSARAPQEPSWRRAFRRSLILGGVVFVLFYLVSSKNGKHDLGYAVLITVVYTALFIPFTYFVNRWTYSRWQKRAAQQSGRAAAKKR